MSKTLNNRAWWMVLPVLALVAMSAIIPLMTVVKYSHAESVSRQSRMNPKNAAVCHVHAIHCSGGSET